ncbi:hypothetical protein ACFLYK_02650 [Candidatus Cloacimonadota bacterium]
MIKRILLALVMIILVVSCSEKPQNKLLGNWVVDYNETFKAIKKSDIWDELGEEEMEMFPDLLEEMIGGMKITINSKEITTELGREQVVIPYEVISASGDKIVMRTEIEEEMVEITFRIINKNMFMFSSSATDDMDYLVWKRDVGKNV